MTSVDSTKDSEKIVTTAGGVQMTVAELRARVSVVEPGVILMREIDQGTPETLAIMGNALKEAAREMDVYGIVLDLEDSSGNISAEYRRFIPSYFDELWRASEGSFKLLAVAFSGNPVSRVVTKFLIGRMLDLPFTIEKDVEQATEAVRSRLRSG